MLKKVTLLTRQLGENSTTARDPIAVYDPTDTHKDIDFSEIVMCCLSSDDNRLVPCKKYGTLEVEIPAWLSPIEWLANSTAWKWVWGCGCDKTWPETWQRFICGLSSTAAKLGIIKLLSTKHFRSDFRRSLKDRLMAWLEIPADSRQFASPFSGKQWDCLTRYEAQTARRIDNGLYWDRSPI